MESSYDDDIALTEVARSTSTVRDVIRRRSTVESNVRGQEFSLPKADSGKEAYLFLCGCFCIEALVWGFPFSFGVFQEYYSKHEPFSTNPAGIASIGTSASGVMYLGAPFSFAILQRWPKLRRWATILGLATIAVALTASSFSSKVWHLILTQGVLYALGGSFLYAPTILWLDEWFVKRKGLAFGIMWAGTGMAGVAIPFIMGWGLERYGFRTMLRAWGIAMVILAGPLLRYVKPRIPLSAQSQVRRFDISFLRTSTFWILEAGNVLQGLGFFVPNIYLPTYASSLGLSSISGTLLVSLFNTTSVFGAVILGTLIDRLHVTTVILISTIGASLSVFLLWGFATSLPLLCVFSLVYGLFAGGFTTTYTGIIHEVRKVEPSADVGLLFGLLAFGRGIGAVVCGPLSEAMIGNQPWQGQAALGYGSGFGVLIVYTGITAILSGTGYMGRRLGWVGSY